MAHDDVVDDAVVRVSPDLSGFRRKLQRQLNAELAGVRGKIPLELDTKTAEFQKAANFVAGLRFKHFQQQEKQIQRLAKEQKAADDQYFRDLQKRFDLDRKGQEATKKFQQDQARFNKKFNDQMAAGAKKLIADAKALEKARDDALGQSLKDIGKRFDMQLAGEKATRRAVEERAAAERKAAIERQRKDEQYLRFVEGIESEIGKIRQAAAQDEISIEHSKQRTITELSSIGAKERAHLTSAIEKAALRDVEREEKASLARRSAAVTSARSTLDKLKPPKIIDLGGEGFKPTNLLIAGLLSLTPALLAVASSAVQASTGIAALGAAGIGAGLAMTSLLVSLTPVIQAFKLAQTVDIQKSVSAQKATVKSAKELAASTEDRAQALRDMAGAQRDLDSATRDEKNAYAAIHTARQQAIRDLEDLRQSVIDLNNQYRSDSLSVKEAEQQERATNANFFATALEKARAHQDTLDARTRLQETALQRRQKTQDLAKSLKSGIERSDPVLAAKEKARDARNRRLDAQDRIANLKASQSKKAINDAIGSGADAISSTEEQLKRLRAQMSPAQRELLDFLTDSQDLFKSFGRTISQATLPGFTKFLKLVALPPKGGKSTLQILSEYAGELGGKLGKAAAGFGAFTRSPLFRNDMAKIQKNNAQSLETLGKAANTFVKPVLRILAEASPLLIPLSDKLLDLAQNFDTFIEKAEKSGELGRFFERTRIEAKKWYGIFSNVFTLLKNIFTQSLPAGGGLVERLEKFTDTLAKWSESPQGRKEIKDFFDTFGSLPYGDITKMLLQLGTTFVALQAIRWAAINPFFTALGILATEHPDLLARAMKDVAGAVVTIAGAAAAHPEAAAFLIAAAGVLKYSKGARSIAFKLLGFEALGKFITGKIPWLEKFTRTATMNVQAGTVIVSGGGTGPGGTPIPTGGGKGEGKPGAKPGAKPEPKPEPKNKPGGRGFGDFLFVPFPELEGKDREDADRLLKKLKDQDAARRKTTAADAIRDEASFFRGVQTDIRRFPGVGVNDPSIANRQALQDYINARKRSVDLYVQETRAAQGPAAAKRVEIAQLRESKRVLSELLQQYGWTKDKADDFAASTTGLTQKLGEQKVEQDKLKGKLGETAGAADNTKKKFGELKDEIDKVTGDRTIVVKVNGQEKAFADLQQALQYQLALQQTDKTRNSLTRLGIDPDTGDRIQRGSPTTTTTKKVTKKAEGGRVYGVSPHSRADNIPAMLTANEYVHPVDAVRYYGADFMEAVRTKRFPRFAKGGQVWPYKVPMPKDVVPPGYGGDTRYTGRVPKGLGAVEGLVGPVLAAVVDLKRHFPDAYVTSGLRRTFTASGHKSNHWYGHAADIIPPSMAAFEYLWGKYNKVARELIYSPANKRQVYHGKPYLYREPVRSDHFDHIHLALANGGLVPRSFDSGGVLPPGYTLAFNGTGKNETVRTRQQDQAQQGPVRIDRRDLQLLAAAATAGTTNVSMDGRKVAELTNRYNYLPAGV